MKDLGPLLSPIMPFLPLATSMCHVSPHAENKIPISDHPAGAIIYSKLNMCAIRQSDENPKPIEPSQIHTHRLLVPPSIPSAQIGPATNLFWACYIQPKSYIKNLKLPKSSAFWDFRKSEFHKKLEKIPDFNLCLNHI